MQLITKNLKYLIAAVLSISFLLAWNGSTEIPVWDKSPLAAKSHTIWDSLSQEFELEHNVDNARVNAEIKKLLAEQGRFAQILTAATPYIYYILEQTRAHGLPAELALIPFIESEYNPNDHSNKSSALGLWQLLSGTARSLGVQVKGGYDGRRNIIYSTQAAMLYFKDLGTLFKGNWYLAIAAYNAGEGAIEHASKRAGSKVFWDLHVPLETKYYVPRLLAVAAIIKNPQKYGIELPAIYNQPFFTEIKTTKTVDLSQLSKASGIDIGTLNSLNPDYKKGSVPKKDDGYTLLVPVDKVSEVKEHVL